MCLKGLAPLAIALACTVCSGFAQTPACYYIRVPTQAANLGYSAGFKSIGGCAPNTVNVSRLYEYGACVGDRQNQFNSYPDCSSKSGSVTSVDTETCRRVFANGPKDAFVPGSSLSIGSSSSNSFDQGTVCNRVSTTGFFFVQTTCGTFPAVSNQPLNSFFSYRSYSASNCDSFLGNTYYGNGHTSATRIIASVIVVVCVVVGLGVLGALLMRRRRAMQTQQVQMQQFPPQGPVYGGGPQGPYGGHPQQGPFYNSGMQYNSAAPGGGAYGGPYSAGPHAGPQPYGGPYSQPYQPHNNAYGAEGKPVTGVPVGGQPGASSWHTDTSPGTYPPGPNAPTNGQGRPPAV